MPITLAAAIKESSNLRDAQVIAGGKGLNRPIRWTHIIDFPDVAPWIDRGDLLLTTGYAYRDDPDAYLDLLPELAQKGVAGMILNPDAEFEGMPESVRNLADELNFPIVLVPWEVRFVDLTRDFHGMILKEQYSLLDQSFQIHNALTQLVLEGRGFQALAETLAGLLGRSVTIEDPSLNVLAAASVGPIDALRARSIEQHRTPQEIATFLHQEGLFERLQRDRRPQLLFPIPRFGMELERLVAPILVGSDLYGYIWIIASEVPLGELDFLAIERAANVAALIFTRERAIYETAQRIKSGQLDDLLQLDPYRQFVNIREALAHMGIQETFQAMVIEPHCLGMDMRRLTRVLEQNLEREKIKGFAVDRGGKVVVGFSPQDPNHGREFAQMLQTDMGELQIPISIGIGRFSLDPSEFPHSYREALESLRIGCKLALQKPGIWLYQDLGFSLWLDSIPTKVVSASSAGKVIESIAEHDEKKGTEYLRTLEAYIDCLGSQQKAAERLYIHRNTLRQRLARLSDLWPMDLRDPIVFFNISAAVRHWRLNSLE